MIASYRIIPVYTGDVSGAASALYELGGMVVIHDPSGCNSTYNTHDETRWYDEDSFIYISGLTELDVILGNDEKFIQDILYAASRQHPAFIALVSSPVPYLNGTDFPGIARLIEKRSGIPAFFVQTNGTHDYSVGAGEAFCELAKRFLVKPSSHVPGPRIRINLLGAAPLDFDAEGALDALRSKLSEFEILSCWAMGSSLEELKQASNADVNLVISITGLKTAQWMQEHLGIPYVIGCPVGEFTDVLLEKLRATAIDRSAAVPESAESGEIFLVGEPVMMLSLREHLRIAYGKAAVVINPLETKCPGVALCSKGEEDLEEMLSSAKVVIADPLYKPIVKAGTEFIPFSHEAFSGRCFRRDRYHLMDAEGLAKVSLHSV